MQDEAGRCLVERLLYSTQGSKLSTEYCTSTASECGICTCTPYL